MCRVPDVNNERSRSNDSIATLRRQSRRTCSSSQRKCIIASPAQAYSPSIYSNSYETVAVFGMAPMGQAGRTSSPGATPCHSWT